MRPVEMSAPSFRPFLDQVRWVAAALVCVGHAIALLNSAAHGAEAFQFIADMREGAVLIFFVLSGYLVGGTVLRDFERFDFTRYAIARFSRIYIALIPALILTLVLDGSVWLFDPHNPVYSEVWQGDAIGGRIIWGRFSPMAVAGTLLSVEPILGGPAGSAGSLWSLGYEWVFYFAFPAVYGLGYRIRGQWGAAIAALLSIAAVYAFSKVGAGFWLVWLLGAYANVVERRGILAGHAWTSALKAVAAVEILGQLAFGPYFNHQITTPLGGVAGLVFLACGDRGERHFITRFDSRLAHFSYSLYIIHLQIMTAMTALLVRVGVVPLSGIADPLAVICLSAGYVFISLIAAYGFGKVFESRTQDLSRFLRRQFAQPTRPADTI